MVKVILESDPKPRPELADIMQLTKSLLKRYFLKAACRCSTDDPCSVEGRLQVAEEDNIDVRKANAEMLTELEKRISMLNEDHATQNMLNESIKTLREENARLNERLVAREAEISGLDDRVKEFQQELDLCRAQLTTTTQELQKALTMSREDPSLHDKLLDLQDKYSTLKEQDRASKKEVERARSDLREHEENSLLIHKQMKELKLNLQQAEANATAFNTEKDVYLRKSKEEFDMLRIQMEQNFQARLEDEAARHGGVVSTLRRQISEAEFKLAFMQGEIVEAEHRNQDNTNIISDLRAAIAALELSIAQKVSDFGHIEEEIRLRNEKWESASKEQRDLAAKEAELLQARFAESEQRAQKWRVWAEENVAQFTTRTTKMVEKSQEMAETEINGLKEQIANLREGGAKSQIVQDAISSYLRRKGVLEHGATLEEWAERISSAPIEEEHITAGINYLRENDLRSSGIDTSGSASSESVIQNRTTSLPLVEAQEKSENVSNSEVTSAAAAEDFINHAGELLDALSHEHDSDGSHQTQSSVPSRPVDLIAQESTVPRHVPGTTSKHGRDNSKNEPNTGARLLKSPLSSAAFGHSQHTTTDAFPRSLHRPGSFNGVAGTPSGTRTMHSSGRTVIPDSQEEVNQEPTPLPTQPSRRIAQRRGSMAPPAQGNGTITHTQVTEYSIRT
jgi:predicted nuclease with TOPRIM domain